MTMSGAALEQVVDAILAAYTLDELRMAVHAGLGVELDAVAGGATRPAKVFNLLIWSQRERRTDELLAALQVAPGQVVERPPAPPLDTPGQRLTGAEAVQLQAALLDAFEPDELRPALRSALHLDLDDVGLDLPYPAQVMELVMYAQRKGWVGALRQMAQQAPV